MNRLKAYISLLRPAHMAKSTFVIAPIIFSGHYHNAAAWRNTALAVAMMICASSAAYIFNDFIDVRRDRLHPGKNMRPLAAGQVSARGAGVMLFAMLLAGVWLGFRLPDAARLLLYAYIGWNILYTLLLKHSIVVDVLTLAGFYLLRVQLGCVAVGVIPSGWIVLSTAFFTFLIGFSKRYYDSCHVEADALYFGMGETLKAYITIAAACTILAYGIYTVETGNARGQPYFCLSALLEAGAVLLYVRDVFAYQGIADPERHFFRNPALMMVTLAWAVVTFVFIAAA